MTWEELAQGYLAARSELSASTRDLLQRWLTHFTAWARSQQLEHPDQLEPEHLERYHQALLWSPNARGQLYAPNSVGQALQMVRAALRWGAQQEGQADPCRGWLQPRALQPPRLRLTREEVQRLLNVPPTDEPLGLRNRALLATIYSLGLPHSTCSALDVDHLDLAERTLTAGLRRLTLGAILEASLELYVRDSRPKLVHDDAERALFVTPGGRRLAPADSSAMLHQVALAAALPGVTAKVLARAGATHAEEMVQRFLFLLN